MLSLDFAPVYLRREVNSKLEKRFAKIDGREREYSSSSVEWSSIEPAYVRNDIQYDPLV